MPWPAIRTGCEEARPIGRACSKHHGSEGVAESVPVPVRRERPEGFMIESPFGEAILSQNFLVRTFDTTNKLSHVIQHHAVIAFADHALHVTLEDMGIH